MMVKQFIQSLKRVTFNYYTEIPTRKIDS
ncbi:hypothetical protein NC652_024871 [Populus alba x Populus x berolinensis]|uniref:Uncharacterized protein n=1 Tax=Populus alba x Populus x berolinensis TaxID=444605 RepID=A0AAD6M900_9ROSI|nr:hypothetical protein NC652_024871 [Populus alba x Populus x berolinensis]KAJ6981183.1 hypothetical protein NC653_024549 [Populus alba x Populus x berolinensis]